MYERHYNFTGSPFQLTPDARFFYGSRGHSRAIAHLTFGLAQGEGFVVVTGDVGAGKTTLIERLLSQLDHDTYAVARVNTTQVSGDDLFRLALAGFGVAGTGESGAEISKSALLLRFEEALRDHRLAGRRCLLIVDEVQNLALAALEELRMLSNLTENGRASLQTILMGQPQFRRMLASPDLDQLRQRVLASTHLGPLLREETRAYIEHRLTTVGWRGNPHWEDAAFAVLHEHTGGVPRRINRLCGRVLLYGALEAADTITVTMVTDTAGELAEDLEGTPAAGGSGREPGRDGPDLLRRIEALEAQMARRERVFQRLMEMFAAAGGP